MLDYRLVQMAAAMTTFTILVGLCTTGLDAHHQVRPSVLDDPSWLEPLTSIQTTDKHSTTSLEYKHGADSYISLADRRGMRPCGPAGCSPGSHRTYLVPE